MWKFLWLFLAMMTLFLQHHHVATKQLSPNMQKLVLFQFKLTLAINTSASADCDALLIPSHPKTMNWSMSSDYCTWDGVTCDQMTGNVIGLDLGCSRLVGVIPPNSCLFQLFHLRYLNFSFNDFSGPIPRSISNLTQLTVLRLSCNHFSGQIPDSLANLQNLTALTLRGNNLIGQFPSWVANLRQLVTLDLSENILTGPLPSNITTLCLPKLTSLRLVGNLLNGTIPSWLLNLPSVKYLYIGHNRFTGQLYEINSSRSSLQSFSCINNLLNGTIPQSFSQLVNLTSLGLSSNNFSGVLDIEMFAPLEHLIFLDLSHNSISARITSTTTLTPKIRSLQLSFCKIMKFPHFIKSLKNLEYLDLSNNQIDGEIPHWIGSIGKGSLYYLNISHNNLTGGIEQVTWSNLQYLDLQSNMLKGSLPASICNMSSLDVLNLSHNNLSGVLPTCPINLNYSLSVFDLRVNSISGTLPSTLSNFHKLRSLNFHGNKLEGTIPASFAKFDHLEVLDLGSNEINDTFPRCLETIENLQVLILKSNKFHSTINNISEKVHTFPSLRIIDLSDNEFSGPLPSQYIKNFKGMMNGDVNKLKRSYMGNFYYSDTIIMEIKGVEFEFARILTVFTTIDLSRNKFEGEIPEYIGNLESLRYLNLSCNHLTGHIPSLIGNLLMLESLDLSFNQLVGAIPQQLTAISFLSHLNLSQNDLSGHIPQGTQFNTFENDSYVGNLGLCGRPLSRNCINETQEEDFKEDEDDSFFSGFTWKAVVIGFGCGVVLGFVVGYIMFMAGDPKWFKGINANQLVLIRIRRL